MSYPPQGLALARDFEVIAVDQRGVGLSDKPQDCYDTGTQANGMVVQVAAPYLDRTFEGYPVRARLHELGVNVVTETSLLQIDDGSCATASYGREGEMEADAVVLVTSRQSNDWLFRELVADRGDIPAIYATGDCVAPRQVADAVFDGHRLGREIDTLDPAIPLPCLRERSVVTVPSVN